jgi:signal transduction histidine kinase
MTVGSSGGDPSPPATEERLTKFTELVATAVANAQTEAELTASRARVVATADDTRRRIERDLHDGAQQRLVSLALQLREAQAAVPTELREVSAQLDRIVAGLAQALEELREFARGIHPAILAEGGLGPALRLLARRSDVPVALDVRTSRRLPEPVEVAAYYVASEALTNAAKHAGASVVSLAVEEADGGLRIRVRDDGCGGADFARGSGLVGLKDRIEALGGRISVESPRGAGTAILVELPLADDRAGGVELVSRP